jgi:hypothetical protein
MRKPRKQQLMLAVSAWYAPSSRCVTQTVFEGTEFSGGWLTGLFLSMTDIGTALFVLALIGSFVYPRIARAIVLASSLLCLPLYLYFIAPAPSTQIFGFGHEFSVEPGGGLHWDRWAIAGVLTLAVATYVCSRGFAATSPAQFPERG